MAVEGLEALARGALPVKPLQEFVKIAGGKVRART
jgi:hypothetical protein